MTPRPPLPHGLSPYETAVLLSEWTESANDYARVRKRQFRALASVVQLLTLGLSVASTVILGVQDLNVWADLAFALVATTAILSGVEPFFNWRSRWVLAEEAQHRLYRLQEDLRHTVATSTPESLTMDQVQQLYTRYAGIWDDFSRQWLEHRRASGERA